MLSVEQIAELIRAQLPDSEVYLRDLTGGGDHFEAFVISDSFEGKTRMQQHKLVMDALSELLKGPLHALTIKTYTQQSWKRSQEAQ